MKVKRLKSEDRSVIDTYYSWDIVSLPLGKDGRKLKDTDDIDYDKWLKHTGIKLPINEVVEVSLVVKGRK